MRFVLCNIAAMFVATGLGCAASLQDVLTGGYDVARTNAALNETALSPNTVSGDQFGRLFLLPADGQIYAQPLYQQNVQIAGAAHNVVFVATMHNGVYAYDADNGAPLWSVNLGPSVPSANYLSNEGAYTDITPEIGILGTPVIDPGSGTLYVVAATFESGAYYYKLHALDTGSGAERFGGPLTIEAQVKGTAPDNVHGVVTFDAHQHIQRPALLLLNGVVYIAFGSHGDYAPWHGWIVGYSADLARQTAVFNPSPNGYGGSFWNSGRGLSVDAQGSIYAVSSNGDTDDSSDFGDNVLRLNPSDLTIADWFSPTNVQMLDDDDDDLGSSGAVIIPGTSLVATAGKQGLVYLLDGTDLGHMNPTSGPLPESFPAADFGIFNMALWNAAAGPVLYLHGVNAPIASYPISGGQIQATPSSQTTQPFGVPFDGMTVSANGGTSGTGILWVTTADSYPLPSTGTLHAYDAGDLSSELWNSSNNPDRDELGGFVKFANPTVANGKVYVPTADNALAVYGPIAPTTGGGGPTPVITGVVNAASYEQGSLAPGEIVTIFGQNLGPQQLATGAFDVNGNLTTGINGMQITFNGVPAPILYTSAFVMAAIVPFEVSAANQADVQVSADGTASAIQTFNVVAGAPGIFTDDASGKGQAAVLNQDYTLNSADNRAAAGSVISVYATGGGQVDPPDSTGATADGTANLTTTVTATIGGQNAPVLYAGHAPGEVAGMLQVNLQVPDGVSGDVPVVLRVGDAVSQTTATIAVK